jgi:prevent-host-death family protein
METVGVRKLKENLSRYLRRVKSGQTILVTDRKKEVAVIVPWATEADDEKVFQLVQRGVARWSGGKPMGIPSRIASRVKSVSDAVLEDRR